MAWRHDLMAILYFSDVLQKVGLDPKEVKLIRHSMQDKNCKACFDMGLLREYTSLQRNGFSKGYRYFVTFISGAGTLAKLYAVYEVTGSLSATKAKPHPDIPDQEKKHFDANHTYFELTPVTLLQEYENKLTIDWGKSARMWHQKGTTEKPIVSLQPDEKKVFRGFETLILSFDELKEIIDNPDVYEAWHTALSSVYAIYLIVDKETGKHYVGSAYGKEGLLGRWSSYVATKHGHNKKMEDVICNFPDRFHAFQFSIIQILPKAIVEEEVIAIENLWKEKLLSREFGMNEN